MSIKDNTACRHVWVSNKGSGGRPEFRFMVDTVDPQRPVMQVLCKLCRMLTWFNERTWASLGRVGDSRQVRRARARMSGAPEIKDEFATEEPFYG